MGNLDLYRVWWFRCCYSFWLYILVQRKTNNSDLRCSFSWKATWTSLTRSHQAWGSPTGSSFSLMQQKEWVAFDVFPAHVSMLLIHSLDPTFCLSVFRWCSTLSVWSNTPFRSAWPSPSASTRWTGSSLSSNCLQQTLITSFATLWMRSTVCSGNLKNLACSNV